MAAGMLRDDLLSLPGVEGAELDGDAMAPSGVRFRLGPGVDAVSVGDEVQRVPALHGLRSDVGIESAALTSTDEQALVRLGRSSGGLTSVSVSEGRDGVIVEAVAGERAATIRAAGSGNPALDQAVVSAVAEVVGTRSVPLIRSVDVRDLDGTPVVTVMVAESGDQLVGSAVVEGGRAYAVGRAAWAALSSR